MKNVILEKTQKEAETVLDQMDVCTDKTSEKYGVLLQTYQDLMKTLDEEQKRVNSVCEIERKDDELIFLEKKAEAECEIEEKKLKVEKRSHVWNIVKTVVAGGVMLAVNVGTIIFSVRMNNSGEALTSFQNKFIFPNRPSEFR